jgi:hypothetical protein
VFAPQEGDPLDLENLEQAAEEFRPAILRPRPERAGHPLVSFIQAVVLPSVHTSWRNITYALLNNAAFDGAFVEPRTSFFATCVDDASFVGRVSAWTLMASPGPTIRRRISEDYGEPH